MTTALQQLKNWILERHPERDDIPADYDLIENRLIDSLTFVEFVFLLEQVSGRSIDMETIDVDDFRKLEVIDERFLSAVG